METVRTPEDHYGLFFRRAAHAGQSHPSGTHFFQPFFVTTFAIAACVGSSY